MNPITDLDLVTFSNSARAANSLDDKLYKMLKNSESPAGPINQGSVYVSHEVKKYTLNGEGIENSIKTHSEFIDVGSSTLKNSLNVEVDLPVQGFQYVESSTTSTKNTTGWTFNYEYTAILSCNILFASGGVTHKLGLEYAMSHEEVKEVTVSKTWTVAPFSVKVPANKTYRVDFVFEKVHVSGNTKIDADLFGIYFYKSIQPPVANSVQLGAITDTIDPEKREGFVTTYGPAPHYERGVKQVGTSPFSGVQGLDMTVEIKDITDGNVVLVKKIDSIAKFEVIEVN
ncbi:MULTISPECIES: ETX/MTX2 family pore-forming toxin [Serratia]|jgi:hypothetical protein|uniref:ETX/MTX2 family pore-forming toxin n=1 Tax=Serratia TaxID=613 RepID=UPI00384E9F45